MLKMRRKDKCSAQWIMKENCKQNLQSNKKKVNEKKNIVLCDCKM